MGALTGPAFEKQRRGEVKSPCRDRNDVTAGLGCNLSSVLRTAYALSLMEDAGATFIMTEQGPVLVLIGRPLIMSSKWIAIGFVAALAFAAGGAQAQNPQHDHSAAPVAPPAQAAPADPMKMMGDPAAHQRMMADPAMRQRMMDQMGQCRDMMSMMMAMMQTMGGMPGQPATPPKQ